MSGGEQQMTAVARRLIERGTPDDAGRTLARTDAELMNKLFRLIKRVATSGISILLVEQNVHQSLKIAHRGYVMEKGRAVLSGTGQELGF